METAAVKAIARLNMAGKFKIEIEKPSETFGAIYPQKMVTQLQCFTHAILGIDETLHVLIDLISRCVIGFIPSMHRTTDDFPAGTGASLRATHNLLILLALAITGPRVVSAQDNYEIQVYGSELVTPGSTMVELHNNFTATGRKEIENGVLPTQHAFHETLEITHGFNEWFETGFYVFSSARNGNGWQWVGDHIRPRVRIPESWEWPVGLSLSVEAGYQQKTFSEDTWSVEIRPIIDKQIGPWYFAFNPAIEKSLKGLNSSSGYGFSPAAKISYDLTRQIAVGMEYYASLGEVTHFDHGGDQQHQLVPAIDLNFSKDWEFNFGVAIGVTHSTDHLIFKMIIGRRF